MELVFIGTGSGKVAPNRMHASCLIRTGLHSLLIDSGDGITRSLLNANVRYNDIHSIVITHFHPDHFSGLSSLLLQMKLQGRTKPLSVYVHHSLKANLIAFLRMSYLFTETFNFPATVNGFQYDRKICLTDNFSFTAKENNHIKNKHGISHREHISFTSAGLMISADTKNIFYTSDIGSENDLYLFDNDKTDYFISEATHIDIPVVYNAFLKSKADKLFFTHIDENKEDELIKWHNTIADKEKIIITKDGLTIKL